MLFIQFIKQWDYTIPSLSHIITSWTEDEYVWFLSHHVHMPITRSVQSSFRSKYFLSYTEHAYIKSSALLTIGWHLSQVIRYVRRQNTDRQ